MFFKSDQISDHHKLRTSLWNVTKEYYNGILNNCYEHLTIFKYLFLYVGSLRQNKMKNGTSGPSRARPKILFIPSFAIDCFCLSYSVETPQVGSHQICSKILDRLKYRIAVVSVICIYRR
jgi:hypothetical protein